MKRVIVDYAKLTNEILTLLVEKFPDGYDDSNIIRFKNAQSELIEAVEVKTEETIYLVKVSTKLASRLEKFEDEDDLDDIVEPIDAIKGMDLEDEDANDDDEEENDLTKDSDDSSSGNGDEDDEDEDDDPAEEDDEEDEEDEK